MVFFPTRNRSSQFILRVVGTHCVSQTIWNREMISGTRSFIFRCFAVIDVFLFKLPVIVGVENLPAQLGYGCTAKNFREC